MRKLFLLAAFAVSFLCQISAQSDVYEIKSPDKKISFSFTRGVGSELRYRITVDGKAVVDWSRMGYTHSADNVFDISSVLPLQDKPSKVNEVWKPLWGKRSVVKNVYNSQSFQLAGASVQTGLFHLDVRVYDDGVAFRMRPQRMTQNDGSNLYEHTEFNFADDYTAWYYNGERHNIGPEKLSDANGERLPVMTIKAADDLYMALHEADLSAEGWPMRLRSESGSTTMSIIPEKSVLPPAVDDEFTGAWRVLMIGKTPGDLVDSHLIELLNPEPKEDFSWVKPGVYLWPEFEKDSDPTKGDKARDVQRIIKYGKDKGVGVWLYLNDVAGTNYPIEETLAQYEEWGASGVKYGFMNGNPQEKNRKTQEITALCAKHHLMVDYHDYPVHPFGQMRTYPNAVTREYCKAQLDGRQIFQPKTFVTSAFVNMVAGPIDQNNGFLELHQGRTTRKDNNQEVPTTVTGEIARTMITWSGATVIPDIPEYYKKYPSLLEFLSAEKQPWQESITLAGEIGEYIVMARQNKDGDWLIGAATNEDARTLSVPLGFLGKGKFTATVTTDAEDTHYRTNRETLKTEAPQKVNKKTVLELNIAPGGGACVLIKK